MLGGLLSQGALDRARAAIARAIAPRAPLPAQSRPPRRVDVHELARMYAAARASRLSGGGQSSSSADMELVTSLSSLRTMSRALVRDSSIAKNAKRIVQNNVIGTGIGLQSNVMTTRGELNQPVNDAIEEEWDDWCCAENCHTGGSLHFADMERMLMGEIFEAGEIFVRMHPVKFGRSRVPLCLEVVEPERIADEAASLGAVQPDHMLRMGIEMDRFYRPSRYLVRERHRGEFQLGVARSDRYEWVPAEQMFHLRIVERWPQSRGEPWLHTAARKLQDMDGYSEAEIIAARGAASYVWWIKSDDPDSALGEKKADGTQEMVVEPGMAKRLAPGEDIVANTPNRPNAAMDPFMRLMMREVAAGIGVSYESLSRDYSQSNYSSSRLALLDDRDLWRFAQLWFIRNFRERLHAMWLQQAVFSRAVSKVGLEAYATDVKRYQAARFKPRGWGWIDPMKEVQAYALAVRNGFTTVSDVVGFTGDGDDMQDKIQKRKTELGWMKDAGLEFDTDPSRTSDGKPAEPPPPDAADDPSADPAPDDKPAAGDEYSKSARVVPMR